MDKTHTQTKLLSVCTRLIELNSIMKCNRNQFRQRVEKVYFFLSAWNWLYEENGCYSKSTMVCVCINAMNKCLGGVSTKSTDMSKQPMWIKFYLY